MMISKKDISETLSLSCVESYFLAWLKKFYQVEMLYGSSYVGMDCVLEDFSNGAKYQNYYQIPRIQEVAEEFGLCTHKYVVCPWQEAMRILCNQTNDTLCLVRVNSRFFAEFKRSAWREDHYICVGPNMQWINQYPLSEGAFNESRFAEVYDGAVCIYKIGDTTVRINTDICKALSDENCIVRKIPKELDSLEGAIGILRISRKRLKDYLQLHSIRSEWLNKECSLLDKLYFEIHMSRLKHLKLGVDAVKISEDIFDKLEIILVVEANFLEEVRSE